MILLEYEAKNLLNKAGLPIPASYTFPVQSAPPAPESFPVVVKSQVPTGGRGKLGGIKPVNSQEELQDTSSAISSLDIKGFTPSTLLVEQALNIDRELYLSLRADRSTESIELLAHSTGGVEIEENDASSFLRLQLNATPTLAQGEEVAAFFDLESHSFALQDILKDLYSCFLENDATLIEINPLILTAKGDLVAGDCKMTLDDSAAFRHSDWAFEAKAQESNFVTLNEAGEVATIANGAGLAMATVDAVSAAGLTPANFLDIGGGASAESVLEAFESIMKYPNVKAIVINIFAGITRCDEIAKAVITAKGQLDSLPPLFIRLAGNNYGEAKLLLDAEQIPLLPTLQACLQAAAQEVHHA